MATTDSGHIELLPSGSYRVHVYVGRDPVTGRQRRMRRTVKTQARAVRELATLLHAAEAGRAPDDTATLGLALDRYLEVTDLAVSTRMTHESYIRRIIRPVLGDVKLRKIRPGQPRRALCPSEAVLAVVRAAAQDRALCRGAARVRRPLRSSA